MESHLDSVFSRHAEVPFVSVVIPTRNRARMLRDSVNSLVAQDYPTDRFEVIVVDDGSDDRTSSSLAALANERDPRVTYVHQESLGLNAARNRGIRSARAGLVCLVDDDIEAPPQWLASLVRGALRNPDAGCVGGPIRLRLEGKPPRLCGREHLGETELDLGDEERDDALVWGANMAVRKKAIDQIGPFDERLVHYDEHEWEERLLDAGGRIVYVPDAWLWHRRTSESLGLWTLMKNRFKRGYSAMRYFEVRGITLSTSYEIYMIPRHLAHALRRRCAWGLLAAAASLGRLYGLARHKSVRRSRA